MPEVYVHAVEGRTPARKKALMKDITDAVVKHFNTPADAVVVTIVESLTINKAKAGVPFVQKVRGWRSAMRPADNQGPST